VIVVDCEQRTPEWYEARRGVITASEFDKIVTPAKLERSTQAAAYRWRLLAEWLTGKSHENGFTRDWIDRGSELEPEARRYYEALTDREIKEVGFIYRDESKRVGCSPDGLMEVNGKFERGVEIKCVLPNTHVGYLLAGTLPRELILQVQGSMFVTGLKQWDFLAYHIDMQPLLLTVKRDQRTMDALQIALDDFIATMLRERETLTRGGTLKEALEASLQMIGGGK